MEYVKVKHFTAVHKFCSDYLVCRDINSLQLYLFRCIQEYEFKWYLFDKDNNFSRELMAVKLQEVSGFNQAEKLVNGFWNVCKELDSI